MAAARKTSTRKANGPPPKRSDQRRRRNKPDDGKAVDKVVVLGAVPMPPASSNWHEIAKDWYESLGASGQSKFFEPSDWRAAYLLAEVMTKNLRAKRFSAQLFQSVWSAMGDLLSTEADRRRVKMEIERELDKPPAAEDDSEVADLDEYRRRVTG